MWFFYTVCLCACESLSGSTSSHPMQVWLATYDEKAVAVKIMREALIELDAEVCVSVRLYYPLLHLLCLRCCYNFLSQYFVCVTFSLLFASELNRAPPGG